MKKITYITLLIFSFFVKAQNQSISFCDELTFGSESTIYELSRIETVLSKATQNLIFNGEYDGFITELIKAYVYVDENNTLSELTTCGALEHYAFAKNLIYAAAFTQTKTDVFKITQNQAIDASLFVNAMVNNHKSYIPRYLNAFLNVSPSYLGELMYLVIYESYHNNELKVALGEHYELIEQYQSILIQTPIVKSQLSLIRQLTLLNFFDFKGDLLNCFRDVVAMNNTVMAQRENLLIIEWLVTQNRTIDSDFIYHFFVELEPVLLKDGEEFYVTKEFIVNFIKEVRYELFN